MSSALEAADTSRVFAAKVSAGDIAGALECWTTDATIVAADGSSTTGHAEIKARFEELVAAGTTVEIRVHEELICGDVAVATTEMLMRFAGVEPLTVHGDVVYRLIDGHWRIAIDRISA